MCGIIENHANLAQDCLLFLVTPAASTLNAYDNFVSHMPPCLIRRQKRRQYRQSLRSQAKLRKVVSIERLDHTNGSLSQLRGKLCSSVHGSIFSKVGASAKPGAVQFVKLENFQNSKHKFKYAYILTSSGITEKVSITGRFLKRKLQEYEAFKAEIDALESEVGEDQGKTRKKQTS